MPGVTERVESYYRTVIADLPPGMRLPSERAVAEELLVSRTTIRLVLTKLTAEKAITPIHGKGYYKA